MYVLVAIISINGKKTQALRSNVPPPHPPYENQTPSSSALAVASVGCKPRCYEAFEVALSFASPASLAQTELMRLLHYFHMKEPHCLQLKRERLVLSS